MKVEFFFLRFGAGYGKLYLSLENLSDESVKLDVISTLLEPN